MPRPILLAALIALAPLTWLLAGFQDPTPETPTPGVTVILTRHAEKQTEGQDPALSETGERRAQALADLLAHAGCDRLFSTPYRRTQDTLEPLAQALKLEIEDYDPRAAETLVKTLGTLEPGSLAVVSGHSNTVPALVRALGGDPGVDQLGEADYDHLYVVTLARGCDPTTLQLRFAP